MELWICRTGPFMYTAPVLLPSIDRVDIGVDQLRAMFLGLGDSWLVSPLTDLTLITRVNFPVALPNLLNVSGSKGCGTSSPVHNYQGQTYCVTQMRAHSPECCSWRWEGLGFPLS